MSLLFRPSHNDSNGGIPLRDDLDAIHDGKTVGRIFRAEDSVSPQQSWLWCVYWAFRDAQPFSTFWSGCSESLEDAKAAFQKAWGRSELFHCVGDNYAVRAYQLEHGIEDYGAARRDMIRRGLLIDVPRTAEEDHSNSHTKNAVEAMTRYPD